MLYLDTFSILPLLQFNQIQTMMALFPSELAHRVMRAEDMNERARRAGGYVLLEKMAKKHTEAFKSTLEDIVKPEFGAMFDSRAILRSVRYDSYGKPYFVDEDRVEFNISHSENLVACVLSLAEEGKEAAIPVGVDVQRIPDAASAEQMARIAERYFSENERASLPSPDKKEEFCRAFARIWTRKEAYLKCVGVGFAQISSADTENVAADGYFFPISKETVLTYTDRDGKIVTERYYLTVCSRGKEPLVDHSEFRKQFP